MNRLAEPLIAAVIVSVLWCAAILMDQTRHSVQPNDETKALQREWQREADNAAIAGVR